MFLAQHARGLGVAAEELRVRPSSHGSPEVPVKYDRRTGRYAFSLLRYEQHRDGIPVYASDVDVLVRNTPEHAVVMASSRARSLGAFVPRLGAKRVDAAQARRAAQAAVQRTDFTGAALRGSSAELTRFTEAEPVIWAGTESTPETPRLAVVYEADNQGSAAPPERWRFVADAETGDILHKESLIVFEDVRGEVSGYATVGPRAAVCAENELTPYPHAEVSIQGGASAFTDAAGVFTIPNEGTTPVVVDSAIRGEFFVVTDHAATRNEVLSATVTPPGPATFVHNPERTHEYLLAQTNGYVQANLVRSWLLDIHPTYPTIATQREFPVWVNRSDGWCPGNAWYDGRSINFCVSGPGYNNTSFASVNHHEYGHHIVSTGGSGQGEYGEGMSDVIGMLISDEPGLGLGFFENQCDTALRTGDNTCQYRTSGCSTCGSGVHACGQLLSGIVWSIRNELRRTNPESYRQILAEIVVNSVLLHRGTAINAQIAADFLTIDDDDGNIENGTPHRAEICAGFEAHGLSCPPLLTGMQVVSVGDFRPSGDEGGPFTPDRATYTVQNLGPDALSFTVTSAVPWLTVADAVGTLDVGATAEVSVVVNEAANDLPAGTHLGALRFTNTTHHTGDTTRTVTLGIGQPRVQYSWSMDEDPSWTAEGQWQYGVPTGAGGDPAAGYTGTRVYGYNLGGRYPNNLPETHLTTPAIDCSGLSQVSLRFRRWLGIESSSWDHAYVRVSTNGTDWTTVWSHSGAAVSESAWTEQVYDLSSVADGQPTVYVRWTMGRTDGTITDAGWNLDDVEIWGLRQSGRGCSSDADCADASFCNGAEACVSGSCVAGTPPACDDEVSCTVDACNEDQGACDHVADDSACDNGLFCDGAERCDAALGCAGGEPPCRDGLCDEASDSCGGPICTSDADCADDDFCNGVEVCASGACSPGTSWGQACYDAAPLSRNQQSGSFNTRGERWFVVTDTINGWQASEVQGRTIRVNGVVRTPGQMPLPPRVDGRYYFQFTAGQNTWASWSFW